MKVSQTKGEKSQQVPNGWNWLGGQTGTMVCWLLLFREKMALFEGATIINQGEGRVNFKKKVT